jgi:hypothetical protein
MSITFNGTGVIEGLERRSAGGLPNGIIKAAELNSGQSGSAPIYMARAWCFHDLRTPDGYENRFGSANVSGITKHGTGDQTVNFAIPMPDANYAVVHAGGQQFQNWGNHLQHPSVPKTIYGYRFKTVTPDDVDGDARNVNTVFYR